MQEYAKYFYKSAAWKNCRAAYIKKAGGLCERCAAAGIIKPGSIVHHKIYITPDNIKDPEIVLNFDNLELLCIQCHNKEHEQKKRRFIIDSFGQVTGSDLI